MKYIFTCLLIFLAIGLFSQNDIDLDALPEVSELIVVESNPSADTIILTSHGGPTAFYIPHYFDYLEGIPTFSVVGVLQQQHLHPQIMTNSNLTLDEAILVNDTTVAVLRKVVNHYNDLGKTVVLVGHSFGAFVLTEYLDDYGIDDVHRVIPMSGRLNMNQDIWQGFATGYWGGFEMDGITTYVEPTQTPPEQWGMMKLMAAYGYNRWVDSLPTLDLSGFMYVFGENDEAVGRLTDEEIDMILDASGSILAIENGSHSAPYDEDIQEQVVTFIRSGSMLSTLNQPLLAKVKIYPTIIQSHVTVESEKEGDLWIANMNGQIVQKLNCSAGSNQIALHELPAGYYVASFKTKDNEISIQKLVKMK